jgi:dipeptidyl aminopeptidase/acylaminoacyl peptidase
MALESVPRLQLIDLQTHEATPLLDAPSGFLAWNGEELHTWWSVERHSVLVTNTFLPLPGTTGAERTRRSSTPAIAEIDLTNRSVRRVAWLRSSHREDGAPTVRKRTLAWDEARQVVTIQDEGIRISIAARGGQWKPTRTPSARVADGFEVHIRSGIDVSPRVSVSGGACGCERALFDPTPNLARQFTLAKAESLTWKDANGIEWRGALLMPPNPVPGRECPLVVQTHGFDPEEFLVDGPFGITTAMAAQPLANAGMAVLQIDESAAATTSDGREAKLFVEGMRAGIRALLARGTIDEQRIGLVAFSRTGLHAVQLIADEPDLFAAVVTADAAWFGYVQDQLFMSAPGPVSTEYHGLTAGKPGTRSIAEAAALDPLYRVARSHAAWRIEANHPASLIAYWELYTSLQRAGRAVEVAFYPQATHVLLMPDERLASQQGTVDWFRRWLQKKSDATGLPASRRSVSAPEASPTAEYP